MQDHQEIQVTAAKPVFYGDRSHEPGDVFAMSEERAVREGLAGRVAYEESALSPRARTYLYRLKNPIVGGPAVAY
jgi:hypothetical protein